VIFTETPLRGAFVIGPEPVEDARGLFARPWCRREFEVRGLETGIAQCSTSSNKRRGTLRGMHYQVPSFAETKIVRSTRRNRTLKPGDVSPTSPYGGAKWAASTYGRMFHGLFEPPVVIARTYMTYGPGQPSWKVIPYTILSLLRGETPRFSSGQRQLDWVYVHDVVKSLLFAGSTPALVRATVELGSGTLTPIRDIVAQLVNLLAPSIEPVFNALPDRPRDPERAADIAETRKRIGWRPTMSLDEGLAHTVNWYRNHRSISTEDAGR
jgi:UDP-glucose 4-epimerase